jgi:HAMP domain-containing protein
LRALSALRFRLPLILLGAGAAFVALEYGLDVRFALERSHEAERLNAAASAARAARSLQDPWFSNPEHVRHYLLEQHAAQRSLRLAGLVDGAGHLVECAPDTLRGASLDSLAGMPREAATAEWPPRRAPDARPLADQRLLAMSAPLAGPRSGLRFVLLVDPRARYAAVEREIRAQAAGGAALGVAFVLLMAWLLERWLHAPLRRLQETADQIAAGVSGARAGLRGDDEIARAGGAFDRMADAVERTERELSGARARLDAVLRALSVGVGVLSREHPRLLYVNPRLHELTGAEAGNAADLQALLRRLRLRKPDGSPLFSGRRTVASALGSGVPVLPAEAVITHPDGSDVPIVAHAVPVSLLGGDEFDAIVMVVQEHRDHSLHRIGRARPAASPASPPRTAPGRRATTMADTSKPPA